MPYNQALSYKYNHIYIYINLISNFAHIQLQALLHDVDPHEWNVNQRQSRWPNTGNTGSGSTATIIRPRIPTLPTTPSGHAISIVPPTSVGEKWLETHVRSHIAFACARVLRAEIRFVVRAHSRPQVSKSARAFASANFQKCARICVREFAQSARAHGLHFVLLFRISNSK